MSVDISLDGRTLLVDGARVSKGWGFIRKGTRKHDVYYIVERWGRSDVTFERVAFSGGVFGSANRDLKNYRYAYSRGGYTMSHEEFARFVAEFYRSASDHKQIEEARELRIREAEREADRQRTNVVHEEALSILEAITTALDPTLSDLRKVATGQIVHVYNGSCPDASNPEVRDQSCPVCRAADDMQGVYYLIDLLDRFYADGRDEGYSAGTEDALATQGYDYYY